MKLSGIALVVTLAFLACFVAGVAAAENTSTTDLFEKGNLSIKQEKWNDAITSFKQVVELDPKDSVAWFKLGGSYLQNGNVSDAYDSYQKAIEINPEYADAWAMTGYVLLYGMIPPDAAGALAAYEKAITTLGSDPGVQINYGITNLLTNNFEKAETIFKTLTESDPKNERAWYWLGITLSDNGKLQEGLDAYTKAVEINPKYKDALFAKGDVEGFLGKENESETTFNTLLGIEGDYAEPFKSSAANDAEVYYRLGVIQYNNGNDAEAGKNFDKAVELNPNNHNAWYYKGLVQFNENDLAGARTSLDKATELKDQFANAWYWKGRVDLKEQKYAEGIDALKNATTIDSNLTDAWFYLGGVLGDTGSYEDAVAAFDKLTEIKPDYADAWYFKGLDQYQLEKFTETADSFEKALSLTSDTFTPDMKANAWYILGMIHTNDGNSEEAAKAFNESVALNTTSSNVWNAYGIALNDIKKYDEALTAFDQAITLNDNVSEFWFNKGNVQRNMNQTEEALTAYDKAIAIEPNTRVYNSKGIALITLGQNEKAIGAFDAGLKLDENLAVLWFNKAGALVNLGRFDEAMTAVDKALALDSEYAGAKTLKDQIIQKQGGSNTTSSEATGVTSSSNETSIGPEELPSVAPTVAVSDFNSTSTDNLTGSQS